MRSVNISSIETMERKDKHQMTNWYASLFRLHPKIPTLWSSSNLHRHRYTMNLFYMWRITQVIPTNSRYTTEPCWPIELLHTHYCALSSHTIHIVFRREINCYRGRYCSKQNKGKQLRFLLGIRIAKCESFCKKMCDAFGFYWEVVFWVFLGRVCAPVWVSRQ